MPSGEKNDHCYLEPKNYALARRMLGYLPYDTQEELELLNQLYSQLRLDYNFFQESMKQRSKERQGSKVRKRYDEPKSPCEPLLESAWLGEEEKSRLRQTYEKLNVVKLKAEIDRLQRKLWRLL